MNSIRQSLRTLDPLLNNSFKTAGTVVSMGKKFEKILDKMESIPVIFGKPTEQKEDFQTCLDYAEKVREILGKRKGDKTQAVRQAIDRKIVGLMYRIEGVNGGKNLEKASYDLVEQVFTLAIKWKISQNFYSKEDKKLNERDIEKLSHLSLYPEFCKLLIGDKVLQKHFFEWVIRDNIGVEQYIQFPATSDKLNKNYIAERLGRFAEEHFKISKYAPDESTPDIKQKVVTLPFNTTSGTKHLNILDESTVVELKRNWKLSIHDIFKLFSKKHEQSSDLEFFKDGITNWHSYELGEWDPKTKNYQRPQFDEKTWVDQLPTVEELTVEQIESRYGEKPEPGLGKIFVVSKRNHNDLDVIKRHSYFEIAIPSDNGKFKIISLGIYPVKFPESPLEALKFLAATVLSKVVFPDLNIFLPRRQYAIHPLKLTKEEFNQIIENIGKEILAGLNGDLTFKFIDENCSYWTQKTVNEVHKEEDPNYFEMSIKQSKPKGFVLKWLFAFLNALPPVIRGPVIRGILGALGGHKGIFVRENGNQVYRSVLGTAKPYNNITMYQPGVLYNAIMEKRRAGKVSFGH